MKHRSYFQLSGTGTLLLLLTMLPAAAFGATFGKVVPIGGHASDIALDEARGVLYIANFSANRIDVMSLADYSIRTSINVGPQPGSIALSPDGQYLVVAHFGNFAPPIAPSNALSVINLNSGNLKQTFALGFPPLGVAFGLDNQALVVTTNDFLLFDPASGATQQLDTITGVTAKTLPVAPANFPPQIIAASLGTSADGLHVYGLTDTIHFSYSVITKQVVSLGYQASPPLGPRVVSVSRDGSYYTAGWALWDASGVLNAQFVNPSGQLNVGSHAIDSSAGIIYAQVPEGAAQSPTTPPISPTPTPAPPATAVVALSPFLSIVEADNLALREKLQLSENLAGKALLNSALDVLYSISDSGVTVLPVGSLNQQHRVTTDKEDIVFRGNFCDRRVATQDLAVIDPGGGNTDFRLSTTTPGIVISPASGVTPATVRISVDPSSFQQKGTVTASIQVSSVSAVNSPTPVRVLINNHEPDQRGTFVNIPGKLVDLIADPARDRFYVLRQDRNQVLVFDGSASNLIATLRTSNVPWSMAITFDRKHLLVGHDSSWLVYVYDLDSLQMLSPIRMPPGHYPRSIAASGNAILAASRVAGPVNTIDRLDLVTRTGFTPATLGIFKNEINVNTVLSPSPNGSSIFAAEADGTVLLYNANADTFTASRKDFASLSGAYAASSYDHFIVDNKFLNASLVAEKTLDASIGSSSGFSFVDDFAFRTTSAALTSPGVIQRVDMSRAQSIRPTRMVESPLISTSTQVFTRTLAPLYSRNAIASLTTSGVTLLSWNYDAAVAPPRIDKVVNAADLQRPVAPGGLISVFGDQLSPVNIATREIPLPTALADSCLTVNGVAVPMIFASFRQINAQLPFNVDGNATMILRTPGGVSDNYNLLISPSAPSIFRSGTAGPDTGIATVIRDKNHELVTLSNPIHPDDQLVIFVTGLGRTSPSVDAGLPSPSEPLAAALIPPKVTLGGAALQVGYAGLAPGEVGVYQINATVPPHVPLGIEVPFTISAGGNSTTLSVRVVK